MGHEGDDLVSLPAPPPPNPAARRSAIDTALRKFDGIEGAAPGRTRPPLIGWASSHRRAAGGLVTAALVALLAIPVVQVALREQPSEVASEAPAPKQAPAADAAPAAPAPAEPQATPDRPLPTNVLPIEPHETAPNVAELRSEPVAKPTQAEEAAPSASVGYAPAAPARIAPPPPPPPPAPPPPLAAERQAMDVSDSSNIIVTGSRMKRANQESAAPVSVIDPFGDFLLRLSAGLLANDRRAVLALVGSPLRVKWNGETQTYRSRKDVERDFDRIFTASVRHSLNNQLVSRDNGRLMGNGRIWFGCGARTCSSADTIRIREVNP